MTRASVLTTLPARSPGRADQAIVALVIRQSGRMLMEKAYRRLISKTMRHSAEMSKSKKCGRQMHLLILHNRKMPISKWTSMGTPAKQLRTMKNGAMHQTANRAQQTTGLHAA